MGLGAGLAFCSMQWSNAQARESERVLVANGLTINRRSSWAQGLEPKSTMAIESDVKFLLVHHTAGTTNYKPSAVPAQIRQVYGFHTSKAKNWPDVCYNFFVDRYGGIWEGRAGSLRGPVLPDATGGSQGYAQTICLLGNFEINSPTNSMIESCANLLAWLSTRYRIKVDQSATVRFVSRGSNKWKRGVNVRARPISGHRDMSATLCPGKFVYPLLETDLPSRILRYQIIQSRSSARG
jgi:hypothetical protein